MNEDKSYLKMKSYLDQIRYEFTNQDTVVFMKIGSYCKAVGNSAIMLKILGAKTKLHARFSASYKQDVLELRIHSSKFAETKEYLNKISSSVLRDDEIFYIVRLKTPVSAKQLKRAKANPLVKQELAEDALSKHRSNTPMANEVRTIFKEIALLVRTTKTQESAVLGSALLNKTIELQSYVRQLTRCKERPSEKLLQSIDDSADDLQGLLLLVSNIAEQATRLAVIGRSLETIRVKLEKLNVNNSSVAAKS